MKNIAIFASGEGTNAQRIIDYFKSSDKIKVSMIISNKPMANVLHRAKNSGIPTLVIDRNSFYETNKTIEQLKEKNIDLIVLAGFLWMIPVNLINTFPDKIINIHPALLPKYGGKGMYGANVHAAVIKAKDKKSGISIHYVNEQYDEGKIISQHTCLIAENETTESLAKKIHELEYIHLPKAIEQLLS
ncbi:MAG: phosphoribosylglycinamide formyltransferase [Bacteroidota bacterium]